MQKLLFSRVVSSVRQLICGSALSRIVPTEKFVSKLIWNLWISYWWVVYCPCSLALSGAATITFFYSLGEHGLQTALMVFFLPYDNMIWIWVNVCDSFIVFKPWRSSSIQQIYVESSFWPAFAGVYDHFWIVFLLINCTIWLWGHHLICFHRLCT